MKKLTFYEQVGIVIPGAVFLFGLLFYFPALKQLLAKDGVSVGQLGIFLLLAYAAGHLIAALGNVGENILWRLSGGMPSDWVIKEETTLLSPQQRDLLTKKIFTRLGIVVETIRGLDRKVWWPISRQLYADISKNGKRERIDTFNGNYGLNRGLAAACVLLACIALSQADWAAAVLLFALGGVYAYRAYRFGVHYARELYIQFLTIAETRQKTERKKAVASR